MNNILIINDLITGGGVEVILKELVFYLYENNYNISVMTLENDKDKFYNNFPLNVNYSSCNFLINTYKKYTFKWLIKVFVNKLSPLYFSLKKYDIVIALKEGLSMKIGMHIRGEKKYGWVHVDYNYMYWTKGCFGSKTNEIECMRKYTEVICVSTAVKNSIINVIGNPNNLCVRYNPVNYKHIDKVKTESINLIKDKNQLLFIAVGRLDKIKNYSMLVDIVHRLNGKYEFELWIIGDGNERQEIEKKILDYKIENIKLLGIQDNPYKFIKEADCFISTSICESYGLAIQEALILGVPVIAVRCPAIEEVFDNRFGLLVELDENSIYDGIERVIKNPQKLEYYKRNIKKNYKKEGLYLERLKKIETLWK